MSLALALTGAGHQVIFATAEPTISELAALGFQSMRAGVDAGTFWEWKPTPPYPTPGAYLLDKTVPDLERIGRDWSPALIVHEQASIAGAVAAEILGLPHAVVQVFPSLTARPPLNAFDGLPALAEVPREMLDPAVADRYLKLSGAPRSLLDPAQVAPPTLHSVRPFIFDQPGSEGLPEWVTTLPRRPTVYATLGTSPHNRGTPVYRMIVEALRDEPFNLIVTVGRDNDPAEIGPLPANAHVERYIPQSLLAPYWDLIIAHGGWTTTMTALRDGIPMLFVPIDPTKPWRSGRRINAERCRDLGLAEVLYAPMLSPEAIRQTVWEMLANPEYRVAAQRLRQEIAALPDHSAAVALLEKLAEQRKPMFASTP